MQTEGEEVCKKQKRSRTEITTGEEGKQGKAELVTPFEGTGSGSITMREKIYG